MTSLFTNPMSHLMASKELFAHEIACLMFICFVFLSHGLLMFYPRLAWIFPCLSIPNAEITGVGHYVPTSTKFFYYIKLIPNFGKDSGKVMLKFGKVF